MAFVEDALYTRLAGFTTLTDLTGLRIYPLKLEPGTALPAVTYQRIGSTRDKLSGADNTTRSARFELSCWGDVSETAKAVAAQVVAALDRWKGTVAGVVIDATFIEDEDDRFEDNVSDSQGDMGVPRANVEVEVWYEQP